MDKKEITNEEVINEFKEIKNTSTGGLIFIIIILILALGASIYYIYTLKTEEKVNNKCAENEEIKEENKPVENIPENNEEKKEDEEEKLTIKKGHVLSSTIGNFIIDKTGIVYYENFEEFEISGIKIKLTEEVLSTLGKKEKYVNNTYQNATDCVIEASGCTVEGYKLDLEYISSAYETYNGNGEISTSIIFISYDGQVSELIFKEKDEKQTIEITKNNPKYKDIVSVVPNKSFGGNSTILIDKYGNKHEYK